jgi:hypothetical protein
MGIRYNAKHEESDEVEQNNSIGTRGPFAAKPFTVIGSAVLAAAIGAAIILYDAHTGTDSPKFVKTPQFTVWLFLIITQTAVFALVAVPLWKTLRELKRHLVEKWVEILMTSVVFAIVFGIPFVIRSKPEFKFEFPLNHHHVKIGILGFIGFIIALSTAIGIWVVHVALRNIFMREEPGERHIVGFLQYRDYLQRFLSIAGAILGLTTLATGALRNALITYGVDPTYFPSELVLGYGLYYSALLALTYAPTYASMIRVGRLIRDALCPLPSSDTQAWRDWYSNRRILDDMLKLQIGARESLPAGVAILAPLGGSVLSVLLGGGRG